MALGGGPIRLPPAKTKIRDTIVKITRFNKAIVSGVAMLLDAFVASMGDNVLDMNEKQHLITTLFTVGLGVWAVWRTPNAKDTPNA